MPKLSDNDTIQFGVHKGKKLANVPASYLLWLDKQQWLGSDLKAYIRENKDVLDKEINDEKKAN